MFKRITQTVLLCIVTFGCFLLSCPPTSCDAAGKTGTFYGTSKQVGAGTARTFVLVDNKGKPVSLGIEISKSAISKLPVKDTEYTLALPKGVSVPPFRYAVLNWNPHGHIPKPIYNVPHFDFHFYLITEEIREKITFTGADKKRVYLKPPAKYIAKDYIQAPGGGEPRMGSHWVDLTSPEFNGKSFTYTFVYGFYNGHLAFIEPMVTKSFLNTLSNISTKVKVPQKYEKSGYYPLEYSVKYDGKKKWYAISLDKLTFH
jgi:hypothetical protein